MHVFEFCFYATGVIYALFYEPVLILIFITLFGMPCVMIEGIYDFFRYIYYPGNFGGIRKRL